MPCKRISFFATQGNSFLVGKLKHKAIASVIAQKCAYLWHGNRLILGYISLQLALHSGPQAQANGPQIPCIQAWFWGQILVLMYRKQVIFFAKKYLQNNKFLRENRNFSAEKRNSCARKENSPQGQVFFIHCLHTAQFYGATLSLW